MEDEENSRQHKLVVGVRCVSVSGEFVFHKVNAM